MTLASAGPHRFGLLAEFIAERRISIAETRAGGRSHTDGQVVFISADADADVQRREVLLQSALLSAGSLDPVHVRRLLGRPHVARRYLMLEGHRVLAELGDVLALAAQTEPGPLPRSASSEHSLAIALRREKLDAPPDWFGTIKPTSLLRAAAGPGSPATDTDVRREESDTAESDEDAVADRSWILRLFESPVAAGATTNFLRALFGRTAPSTSGSAGADSSIGSTRRSSRASEDAQPRPTPIRFSSTAHPAAAVGVGGALHPEWDVHRRRYRSDWCRVVDFPMDVPAHHSPTPTPRDAELGRRLARVALGPRRLRGRAHGDDLDTDALVDVTVDVRSGHSPPEHIYVERRPLARSLGVLILVDVSGSATDSDPGGVAVHHRQRLAAATLAATLEELGDRVAVYGFWSQGRHSVRLAAIKTFGQRFGVQARTRLDELRPTGYTRLGAGIRGCGDILRRRAGTPHRLLLVLSDGYPYDDGYEGRYAEADSRKALDELRSDGVACLCISLGAATDTDTLDRVFGSTHHVRAATLAELTPRMDEMFMTAVRELSASQRRRV